MERLLEKFNRVFERYPGTVTTAIVAAGAGANAIAMAGLYPAVPVIAGMVALGFVFDKSLHFALRRFQGAPTALSARHKI